MTQNKKIANFIKTIKIHIKYYIQNQMKKINTFLEFKQNKNFKNVPES